MKYFKYLILLNLLICVLSEEFNDPFDLLAAVDDKNGTLISEINYSVSIFKID